MTTRGMEHSKIGKLKVHFQKAFLLKLLIQRNCFLKKNTLMITTVNFLRGFFLIKR